MDTLAQWHGVLENQDMKKLDSLLDKSCVFYSPLLFKPQKGKSKTKMYLQAAAKMFEGTGFHYVKETKAEHCGILEFEAKMDGLDINGVDIITWNEEGKITEFKVMLRPFRATEKVGQKMKELLESMSMLDKLKFALK